MLIRFAKRMRTTPARDGEKLKAPKSYLGRCRLRTAQTQGSSAVADGKSARSGQLKEASIRHEQLAR